MAQYRSIAFRIVPDVIAAKAAAADVDAALALKAAAVDVTAALAAKADSASVDAAVAAINDALSGEAAARQAADVAESVARAAAASDVAALDSRVGGAEAALLGKADQSGVDSAVAAIHTQFDDRVSALHQAALVLVGADGALQINQQPGSANTFVYRYDGTTQTLT